MFLFQYRLRTSLPHCHVGSSFESRELIVIVDFRVFQFFGAYEDIELRNYVDSMSEIATSSAVDIHELSGAGWSDDCVDFLDITRSEQGSA